MNEDQAHYLSVWEKGFAAFSGWSEADTALWSSQLDVSQCDTSTVSNPDLHRQYDRAYSAFTGPDNSANPIAKSIDCGALSGA